VERKKVPTTLCLRLPSLLVYLAQPLEACWMLTVRPAVSWLLPVTTGWMSPAMQLVVVQIYWTLLAPLASGLQLAAVLAAPCSLLQLTALWQAY
jgi:hypothetical protein